MVSRTPEEFLQVVQEKHITAWPTHECSICGYLCGFQFSDGDVFYDAGCYCTNGSLEPRTWRDIAVQYNIQISLPIQEANRTFWGFPE